MHSVVAHTYPLPKTGGTALKNVLERSYAFVDIGENVYIDHGQLHTWQKLNSTNQKPNEKILVTAETGINDLFRRGYPYFDSTCFFSIARESHSWVLSANNHMKTHSNYSGGINGTWGFFDTPNIQSTMVGFGSSKRGVRVCMTDIEEVNTILTSIVGKRLPSANIGSYYDSFTTKDHDELQQVVKEKYFEDLKLWEEVKRSKVLCW